MGKWTKVKCSKCQGLKNTNPVAYASRLAKFEGSVERMEKEWICRECNSEGKPKKEKKVKEETAEETPVEGQESMSEQRRKEILKKTRAAIVKNIPVADPIHEEEAIQLEEEF